MTKKGTEIPTSSYQDLVTRMKARGEDFRAPSAKKSCGIKAGKIFPGTA